MTPDGEVTWSKEATPDGNLYLSPDAPADTATILTQDLAYIEDLPVLGHGNRGNKAATVYSFAGYALRCLPAYRCLGFAEPQAGLEWARANLITQRALRTHYKPGAMAALFEDGVKTPEYFGMFLSNEYLLFLMSDCSIDREHPLDTKRGCQLGAFVNGACRTAVEEEFPGIKLSFDRALNNIYLGRNDAVQLDVNPEARLLF